MSGYIDGYDYDDRCKLKVSLDDIRILTDAEKIIYFIYLGFIKCIYKKLKK